MGLVHADKAHALHWATSQLPGQDLHCTLILYGTYKKLEMYIL